MKYKEKQIGGWKEFQLDRDRLEVRLKRNFFTNAHHEFPKSAFSNSSGWTEERNRETSAAVQGIFTVAFIAVIFFHVRIENAGPTLWAGIILTILGMVFGPLLCPKRRQYIAYSSSGQPILVITEHRGAEGKKEFEHFVAALKSWTNSEVEPGAGGNAMEPRREGR